MCAHATAGAAIPLRPRRSYCPGFYCKSYCTSGRTKEMDKKFARPASIDTPTLLPHISCLIFAAHFYLLACAPRVPRFLFPPRCLYPFSPLIPTRHDHSFPTPYSLPRSCIYIHPATVSSQSHALYTSTHARETLAPESHL